MVYLVGPIILLHYDERSTQHCIYADLNGLYIRRVIRLQMEEVGLDGRPRFDSRSVNVRFVVDKLASGRDLIPVRRFSLVSLIAPLFRNN
jgi:hypothetical protein